MQHRPRLIAALLLLCTAGATAQTTPLIPQPRQWNRLEGESYALAGTRHIQARGDSLRDIAALLSEWLRPYTTAPLPLSERQDSHPGQITLRLQPAISNPEGYRLRCDHRGITVEGATARGVLLGVQTLRQLLPAPGKNAAVTGIALYDEPALPWRGGHLDVGRHFMPVETVKRYLDLLAFYKFNVFHWHLTEDQGWRIEIRRYPRLTSHGAWRTNGKKERYGGFYTQAQIRDVVAYAARRHIMVVPEIELPGHCMAALSAYPELSCREEPFAVPVTWGVKRDVYCAGKDTVFRFLENVLEEVTALFPAPYLHIGGDEVPKTRWKACPNCQRRIANEGLSGEHDLQSYFIRRIAAFLQKKGKTLVGWDEILEGGAPAQALIEIWRGDEQARTAAKAGHAFLTTSYFDASPAAYPLEKVYAFRPVPDSTRGRCLGTECCVWTEGITPYLLEPMVLPRLAALSEAIWGSPKDYPDFKRRLESHYAQYRRLGWQAGPEDKTLFRTGIRFDTATRQWVVRVQGGFPGIAVSYALPGDKTLLRTLRSDTIAFGTPGTFRMQVRLRKRPFSETISYQTTQHLAWGKKVALTTPPSEKYGPAERETGLTDGMTGSATAYADGVWQGWWGDDLEASVDLGTPTPVRSVGLRVLQRGSSWIVFPKKISFFGSNDGATWEALGETTPTGDPFSDETRVLPAVTKLPAPRSYRFVKVVAAQYGTLPEGHSGAGGKTWIFADELEVR